MSFLNRFGFGKRKENVTPDEMGSLLFSCAARWASKDSETPSFFESIGVNVVDKRIFRQELLIVIMYATVNIVTARINPEDKASRVLDAMNNAFINRWKPEDKQKLQRYVGIRYNEYQDAQEEKRGPNQLWPLAHHVLKNLLGKETIDETALDAVSMTSLVDYYTSTIKALDEVLGNLRITY